jgi:membrane fusion protein, multidrug efflux system
MTLSCLLKQSRFWVIVLFFSGQTFAQTGGTVVKKDLPPTLPPSSAAVSQLLDTTQVVLTAKKQATLSSQLQGTILQLPLNEGDRFNKGDDLVIFDCTTYEAQLAKAKAIQDAKAAAYRSNQQMSSARAISNVELITSKAEYINSSSEVKIQQHNVDFCRVKAPFSGILVKRRVHEFETVQQGQQLVEVLDNSDLTVELIVPSSWLVWLRPDSRFTLVVEETHRQYPALITRILPIVDSVSQSVRVLGKISGNSDDLIAGMSGKAVFNYPKTS